MDLERSIAEHDEQIRCLQLKMAEIPQRRLRLDQALSSLAEAMKRLREATEPSE